MKPLIALLLCWLSLSTTAQTQERLPFLQPADTLHQGRFWTCVGAGTAMYSGVSVGLWHFWYKNYERSGFQFFNDWGEWEHQDKAGHFLTAYHEAQWVYQGARWTGMSQRSSLWTGVAVASGLQLTVEMMDAFSAKWGFSWPDVAFNTLGVSLFAAQELLWQEQRIGMKVSSTPMRYPDVWVTSLDGNRQSSLQSRAEELFGSGFPETFFKDYNALITWVSVNPASFLGCRKPRYLPAWLNVSVGYGAQNMFGGFRNEWPSDNPMFVLSSEEFPRYRQFYLSLDVDFSRIPTRSRFLRTVFRAINFLKVPAPVLEYNTLGQWRLYPVYW